MLGYIGSVLGSGPLKGFRAPLKEFGLDIRQV